MFWILILIAIIAIVVCVTKNKATDDRANKIDTSKICVSDASAVNKGYANEAIKFFDGYLSLCKKHSVMAVCSLHSTGTDELGISTEMHCAIIAIDGEHAGDAFETVKRVWTQLRQQEKLNSGDYDAVVTIGDNYMKEYFGCENLHYAFTEVDEYQFSDGQVIVSFEREMFTRGGCRWESTLSFIKQELQKKWVNATIDVDKNGIMVKP